MHDSSFYGWWLAGFLLFGRYRNHLYHHQNVLFMKNRKAIAKPVPQPEKRQSVEKGLPGMGGEGEGMETAEF